MVITKIAFNKLLGDRRIGGKLPYLPVWSGTGTCSQVPLIIGLLTPEQREALDRIVKDNNKKSVKQGVKQSEIQ